MVGKLDRMIQPGERVVFRTRMGWRRVLWSVGVGAALAGGWHIAFAWAGAETASSAGYLMGLVVAGLMLFSIGTEGVVTDLRVLHKSGLIRPEVVELPLWHIERLEHVDDHAVMLRDRAGAETMLHALADGPGFAAAILAETGGPGPEEPEMPAKVKAWARFLGYYPVYCGLGLTLLGMAAVTHGIVDLHGLENDHRSISVDLGAPYELVMIMVMIMGLLLGTVVAVFIACLAVGGTVGMVLLMPAMRLALTVEEARALLVPAKGDGEDGEKPRSWFAWLDRMPLWAARRTASLLYGERV